MKTIHKIKIDLLTPGLRSRVYVVQDDICTREVQISLYSGGASWSPAKASAAVGYSKPDGTAGLYDSLPDGSAAISISGNVVTVILAAQMLTCAGTVEAAVTLADANGNQISTFAFDVIVSANPGSSAVKSEDYFNYVNPRIRTVIEGAEKATTAANAAADRANAASTVAYQANEKVDTLREVVSKLHSNIVETASGKVITVSDSAEAPLQGLKVFGKTQQRTTTGKNLLYLPDKSVASGGLDWKVENGVVTINGKTNTAVNVWADGAWDNTEALFTLAPGTYTTNCTLYSYDGTTRYANKGTFTIAKSMPVTGVHLVYYETGSAVNEIVYAQVEKGSVATEWEPYTGGEPSPSPEYPQALESVGDSGAVSVTVAGKNLLNPDKKSQTETTVFYGRDTQGIQLIAGVTYTFSFRSREDSNGVSFRRKSDLYVLKSEGGKVCSYTPDADTVVCIGCYFQSGVPSDFTDAQLEIGTTATAYEPYKQPQTLAVQTPNCLPGIPVTSGGNYTDANGQQWICDEVDFEKGVYVQRVGKKTISSGVNAYANSSGETKYILELGDISDMAVGNWSAGWCNAFKCSEGYKTPEVIRFGANSKVVFVYSDNANFAGISLANNWFANNPVTVLYILETENRIPLSEEEIAQYAALHTNYPNTTVFNDAGAHMELKYVADTQKYVDKKFEALEAAIANLI